MTRRRYHRRIRPLLRLLISLALVVGGVACRGGTPKECSTGRLEPDDKTLLVGLDTTRFPLAFARPEGSQGLMVELLREAATRAGMELKITYLGRPALSTSIVAQRMDAVGPVGAADIAGTCDSGIWFSSAPALIEKLDVDPDAPVAVAAGSPEEAWAESRGLKTQVYPTVNDVVGAIGSAAADRAVLDSAEALHRTKDDRGLIVVETSESATDWTFAFHAGDGELATKYRDVIAAMKDDGTWARVVKRWTGVSE